MPLEHNFCVVILKKHFPKSLLLITAISSGPAHQNHSFLIQLCNGRMKSLSHSQTSFPLELHKPGIYCLHFSQHTFLRSSYRTARHTLKLDGFYRPKFQSLSTVLPQDNMVRSITTIPPRSCLPVSVLVEVICDVIKYHDQKEFVEEFLLLSYTSISLFIFKGSIEGN